MRSAFAMDRVVGILMRVRPTLGVLAGVLVLITVLLLAAGKGPIRGSDASPHVKNLPLGESSASASDAELFRAVDSPAEVATGVLLSLLIIGLSVLEFLVAIRIGRGLYSGFLWGTVIEVLWAFVGLITYLVTPRAAIGLIASMSFFLYCVARLSGLGPRPQPNSQPPKG